MGPALDRHIALVGFMGAGKSTMVGEVAARIGRTGSDLDAMIEQKVGDDIPAFFAEHGEAAFRQIEEDETLFALWAGEPDVFALGGGAILSPEVRERLKQQALTVWLDVDADTCWDRVRGSDRPLAQDEGKFRRLYEERRPLYEEVADAKARDATDVILAAGAISAGPVAVDGPYELVADERVLELHSPPVEAPAVHAVPQGEPAKSHETAQRLWRDLRLGREGTLVAFGGGCTTDVAGFVAATYLRGIDWIAVPTTLVGQVDAAIGGKTGINLDEGKNLVGAFHWPRQTVLDPSYLATLPDAERRAGMAEVVKTGLLAGEPLWELDDTELVRRCAAYKAALCVRDPFDRGPRQALNLGHTFAHALETASGYELAHGDAVALGLLAALRLSGLPTGEVEELLQPRPVAVDRERAWAALGRDKKASGGRPRLVLLERPGEPRVGVELPDEQVRAALDSLIAS